MSDLETTLRTMARNGRLNHVSVGFINGKWSGAYRGVEDRDGRIFEAADPVAALIGALTGRKIAPATEAKNAPVAATKTVVATKPKQEDEDLL